VAFRWRGSFDFRDDRNAVGLFQPLPRINRRWRGKRLTLYFIKAAGYTVR
jgi:hypothetical protein